MTSCSKFKKADPRKRSNLFKIQNYWSKITDELPKIQNGEYKMTDELFRIQKGRFKMTGELFKIAGSMIWKKCWNLDTAWASQNSKWQIQANEILFQNLKWGIQNGWCVFLFDNQHIPNSGNGYFLGQFLKFEGLKGYPVYRIQNGGQIQ